MPAPAIVKPLLVKQFNVIVSFCAPLAGSVVFPKTGQRQAVPTIPGEKVCLDGGILGTALEAIEEVVAEGIATDWTISPGQASQVDASLVAVDEVAGELRSPCTGRTLVDIPSSIDEEASGR